MKLRSKDPQIRPKVCIIGAGVAGLRCADLLHELGFNVTILEARERVGGRLHQVTLSSGHVVDAGPNWIHGTKQNPIMELAKGTNTPAHTVRTFHFHNRYLEPLTKEDLIEVGSFSGEEKSMSSTTVESFYRMERSWMNNCGVLLCKHSNSLQIILQRSTPRKVFTTFSNRKWKRNTQQQIRTDSEKS